MVFDNGEAPVLLHLVLALYFDIAPSITLHSTRGGIRVRIEGGYTGGRASLDLSPTRLQLRLSDQELLYWCRFLTEVVLGVPAVDHIDLEVPDSPQVGVTLRFAGEFKSVSDAEARRRLGLTEPKRRSK